MRRPVRVPPPNVIHLSPAMMRVRAMSLHTQARCDNVTNPTPGNAAWVEVMKAFYQWAELEAEQSKEQLNE